MSTLRILLFIGGILALLGTMRHAAGRLAPKVGIGALLFIVTRWPFAIGWLVGTGGTLALIMPGAIAKGRDSVSDFALLAGIGILCGGGFAALVVGPIWALTRALEPSPTFELEAGETLLDESPGNHFLNGESRGGTILLTDRRIGFRPHRFNVQLETWSATKDDSPPTTQADEPPIVEGLLLLFGRLPHLPDLASQLGADLQGRASRLPPCGTYLGSLGLPHVLESL